jgi:uncharacterized protein YtpQ (UPF0354 family)
MLKQLRSIFGGKPPASSDPKEIFAAEVEQFLRAVSGVKGVTHSPGEFALEVVTSAGSRRVYLDNAFAESREMSPEQRRERIAFFFSAVGNEEPNESWDAARETFVPVLRGATYGMELWTKQPTAAFVRRPFLPYLDIIVAMDRPTSMNFVSRSTVERWKVAESEVFEAAEARVPLLANVTVERYDETHGPLWVVTSNDSYESSRLLVPGWLASFRSKIAGEPIAIVPERSTLMVAGDGRPEMVERLLDKADREFTASNRRLSPAIYSVDAEGKVVPYFRQGDDPLATKVRIAHEKLAIYEYGQQKEALDKLYKTRGFDVFVANYQVFQAHNGGLPRSLSVWTKGVLSYLPRTERVMLVVLGNQTGATPKATVDVPFETIESRLTLAPDLHPARFQTTGTFPSDRDLRLLGGRL